MGILSDKRRLLTAVAKVEKDGGAALPQVCRVLSGGQGLRRRRSLKAGLPKGGAPHDPPSFLVLLNVLLFLIREQDCHP